MGEVSLVLNGCWLLKKLSQNSRWALKNINEVLQHYGDGDVVISPRGSLKNWKGNHAKKRWG